MRTAFHITCWLVVFGSLAGIYLVAGMVDVNRHFGIAIGAIVGLLALMAAAGFCSIASSMSDDL